MIREISAGSFDFYEGIRIVIPGSVAYAVSRAMWATLPIFKKQSLDVEPVTGVFIVLALGLLLYFTDIPSRSATYEDLQPSRVLFDWFKEWDIPRIKVGRYFFLIFNTMMPQPITSRALYMGSMFKIGFESILLIALSQGLVWSLAAVDGRPTLEPRPRHTLSLVPLLAILIYGLASATRARLSKHVPEKGGATEGKLAIRDRGERRSVVAALRETIRTVALDLGKPGAWIVLVSMAAAALAYSWAKPVLGVGAIGLVLGYWVLAFVRGSHPLSFNLSPIDALTSLVLYTLAAVEAIVLSGLRQGSFMDGDLVFYGWIGSTVIGALLILSRGHERRLRGTYYGQRHWLEANKARVRGFVMECEAGEALTHPTGEAPPSDKTSTSNSQPLPSSDKNDQPRPTE